MKINVKISNIKTDGNVKAYASVNLDDCFAVKNIKIIEGNKGLFVSMPSYKAGNGEYKDICFPVTKEFRQELNDAIFNAYQQALTQNQNQSFHEAEQQCSITQMS